MPGHRSAAMAEALAALTATKTHDHASGTWASVQALCTQLHAEREDAARLTHSILTLALTANQLTHSGFF